MNFELSEEQIAVKEAARDFAWMGPQKLARGSQQLTFRISVITEAQSDG